MGNERLKHEEHMQMEKQRLKTKIEDPVADAVSGSIYQKKKFGSSVFGYGDCVFGYAAKLYECGWCIRLLEVVFCYSFWVSVVQRRIRLRAALLYSTKLDRSFKLRPLGDLLYNMVGVESSDQNLDGHPQVHEAVHGGGRELIRPWQWKGVVKLLKTMVVAGGAVLREDDSVKVVDVDEGS
ncbi:hypothetical protein LR48_Vigan04g242200 [Vigna angularis]|uniref:Uncharacterized protein n=1 Tax=Phaseolus angularis TaxID=3914 RepID=A0A0L9UI41_PHAAN|nr:hypothetical protein LR48_Vigan04g242200 [Vigna angularis]